MLIVIYYRVIQSISKLQNMNILVLDVYPKKTYRISKDQNGAYGTANNYGKGLFCKILSNLVKNSIDFPALYAVQTCG